MLLEFYIYIAGNSHLITGQPQPPSQLPPTPNTLPTLKNTAVTEQIAAHWPHLQMITINNKSQLLSSLPPITAHRFSYYLHSL